MSDPVRFLHALAQTLSVTAVYGEGHPSRERVADAAFAELDALCTGETLPLFTFLDGEVIYGRQSLRELRDWEWSTRLSDAGIGRIEVERRLSRGEFDGVLQELQFRLTGGHPGSAAQRQMRDLGVRFGAVGVDHAVAEILAEVTGGDGASLTDEVETLCWMHEEIASGRALPMLEAEAVVRSLSVAMHGESGMLLPLLQLKEYDQYTTTHSLNVSVLAMALAETLGLSPREVRAIGVSALLHDIGKTAIPLEVLTKPGRLTDEERRLMNRHPEDGARLILASDADLDLAAVVAYEHHIMIDGRGYPALHYCRACAFGSRLVHVCDVFDALSTRRPYREAWPQEQTLAYLEARAGTEFDPALVTAFATMMRGGSARVLRLAPDGARPT